MAKNEPTFLKAYDDYFDAIYRYCYWRVFDKEKAKDIVQETYCRTWEYMEDKKEIKNIKAFLYRIATNIIIDESRKRKNTSLDQIMEKGFVPKADPQQKMQDHLTGKELIGIVKSLDKRYSEVMLLKYVDDLSTKEIAVSLNETENNIYVRISRGLNKVKKIVRRQEA